jgi:hypothetical protein
MRANWPALDYTVRIVSFATGGARFAPSTIAFGLYQHAPQFGKYGLEDDPSGATCQEAAQCRAGSIPVGATTFGL